MCVRSLLTALLIPAVFSVVAIAQTDPPATPGNAPAEQQTELTLNQKAEIAYARGQYAEAERLSSEQIIENSRDHVAIYLRGSARIELGRRARDAKQVRTGIEDARKSIEIGGSSNARYFLPYLYGMTSLTEIEGNKQHASSAIQTADRLIKAEKDKNIKANLSYQRARANMVLEKYEAAELDFRKAITADNLLAAWTGLAEMYALAKKPAQAKETFDNAIREYPRNPLLYNNRGMFLQQNEKNAKAVADFTSALQLSPQFVAGYTNRGYTLMAMGDPEAAELDFSASLGLVEKQPLVLRLRAGCRLLQKQPELAVEDLSAALKMQPDIATHVDLGFAQLINLNFKQSAELLGKVQRTDPKLRHVRPWRFAALLGDKDVARATKEYAADLARVKTQSKDTVWNDWLVGLMAGATTPQQLLAEAARDPKKKIGRTTEAHFFLGMLRELRGDVTTARQHYEKALLGKRSDLAAYRGALVALARTKAGK